MASTHIGSKLHSLFINQTLICYLYLFLIILIFLPPIDCLVLLTCLLVVLVQAAYSSRNSTPFHLKQRISQAYKFPQVSQCNYLITPAKL